MMGLIFFGDRRALYDEATRSFRIDAIKALLTERGIALNDTGYRVKRLMNNASDKFLEIVEPVNLDALLERMPDCRAVATTGEKAAGVIADITGTEPPRMGGKVRDSKRDIDLWRMPSTSRAYPLALEKKAAYYEAMFRDAGVL